MNTPAELTEVVRRELARFEPHDPPRSAEAAWRGTSFARILAMPAPTVAGEAAVRQVCVCRAIEAACGIGVPDAVERLRRLLVCAAWLHAHAAQVFGVQAPALLDCTDGAELARRHPRPARHAPPLDQAGRALTEAAAAAARVGGPAVVPTRARLRALLPAVHEALRAAAASVQWVSGFAFPESVMDVALCALDEAPPRPAGSTSSRYPAGAGTGVLVSTGVGFPLHDFEAFVTRPRASGERTERAVVRGSKAALTGPLARNALAHGLLGPLALAAARQAGLEAAERNPHRSVLIRAVEMLNAVEEAAALIEGYEPCDVPRAMPAARAGRGTAAAEGPFGLLYRRFDLLADGSVAGVRMVGPGELNRSAVELDLRRAVREARRLEPALGPGRLTQLCGRLAGNYVPCAVGGRPDPTSPPRRDQGP